MNVKKIIFLIVPILLLLVFIHESNDDTVSAINEIKDDLTPPIIKKVNPSKCQQYIVGKPTISVSYKDDTGINLSSVKFFVNYKDVTSDCTITNEKITYTPKLNLKEVTK